MHIIIPMSGRGSRFIEAGYKEPKPLVKIDGKSIIEHVCDMFSSENKITFICSEDHLLETDMRNVLTRIRPDADIVAIKPHKLGPVYAVSKMFDLIQDDEEVIVNYCDFAVYWNYKDFLKHTRNRGADGAVPAYKGFHPHMLGSTNYAFMRSEKQWMLEIQEKKPFTQNRMQEYASSGTYYFRCGSFVKKYFQELMDLDYNLNGEYYVSMIFNLLVRDGLQVSIYELQHMLQWGTPEDVAEYNNWSRYFCKIIKNVRSGSEAICDINFIPMAGLGSRFQKAGYVIPKPLINVSGKPMVIQALDCLPSAKQNILVMQSTHEDQYKLSKQLSKFSQKLKFKYVNEVTNGQATTCYMGLDGLDKDSSMLIGACDNGMIINVDKFNELRQEADVIVFTFKNHIAVANNPNMYGYVVVDSNDNVEKVLVKKIISNNPLQDHAIVGTFYFKTIDFFNKAYNKLIYDKEMVNGEYYVDSLVNKSVELGLKVKIFLVDEYLCWGTPNDYETFVYWQSFFHKATFHPYSLSLDSTVNKDELMELDFKYHNFSQEYD